MQASAVRGSALEISGTEMQGAPVADGLKLGAAQLLGRFVVDTPAQYEAAARAGAVDAALRQTGWRGDLRALLDGLEVE